MMEMYPACGLVRIGNPGNMPFNQCRQLRKLFVVGNSNSVALGQRQVIETVRFALPRCFEFDRKPFPTRENSCDIV